MSEDEEVLEESDGSDDGDVNMNRSASEDGDAAVITVAGTEPPHTPAGSSKTPTKAQAAREREKAERASARKANKEKRKFQEGQFAARRHGLGAKKVCGGVNVLVIIADKGSLFLYLVGRFHQTFLLST